LVIIFLGCRIMIVGKVRKPQCRNVLQRIVSWKKLLNWSLQVAMKLEQSLRVEFNFVLQLDFSKMGDALVTQIQHPHGR